MVGIMAANIMRMAEKKRKELLARMRRPLLPTFQYRIPMITPVEMCEKKRSVVRFCTEYSTVNTEWHSIHEIL